MMLGELIGRRAKIIHASCPEYIGASGTIVDETKNMIAIRTEKGVKKFPKKDIILTIEFPHGEVTIEGEKILFRPEERTKKLWRKMKWWKRRAMTRNVRTTGM